QLAGGKSPEQLQNEAAAANSNMPVHLLDTYKAWAMPGTRVPHSKSRMVFYSVRNTTKIAILRDS
ncbi:hypothetical protein AB9E11_36115, partial [Rhizobium leguminosarum]